MKFEIVNDIIEQFKAFINSHNLVLLCFDIAICLGLIVGFVVFTFKLKKVNLKWLIGSFIFFIVLLGVAVTFDLYLLYGLYKYILLFYAFLWSIYYVPEVRDYFKELTQTKNTKDLVESEEARDKLIDILAQTVEHLSERQIGAIITIERQDSLNTYIEKGTYLNSEVSKELLDTIFMPGTDLHDGAVIIRGNKIMCAGAFYPTSKNATIPKTYGSRHRAALGISENSDAFTIVVSEETGNISYTQDTTLTTNISVDGLKLLLKENIIINK